MSTEPAVRVRMYRQGLGDCLLLSLLNRKGNRGAFHMMFDCGVLVGTKDAAAKLSAVVADIARETGGFVDVLVVTHEHYDHVSGFKLAADGFAPRGKRVEGKLSVGEVWYGWTEDPKDETAKTIRAERAARLERLADKAKSLGLAGAELPNELDLALGFFGVDKKGGGVGATRQGMEFPRSLVALTKVHYLLPGELPDLPDAPELRVYVLGPPKQREALRKTDSVPEVYHLAAAPGVLEEDGSWQPFEQPWRVELSAQTAGSRDPTTIEFLRSRYYGPETPTPETDIGWRQLGGTGADETAELALALDSATNNTSVALAIELVDGGDVLLFPADAQVGNWLSWHSLTWKAAGKPVDAADLLGRTVFYKVGHHGSHNATLKAKGVEMMPESGLVSFIPVDHEMACSKGWDEMPLGALVRALMQRGTVVQVDDEGVPATGGFGSGGALPGGGALYYEWTREL